MAGFWSEVDLYGKRIKVLILSCLSTEMDESLNTHMIVKGERRS